MTLYGRCYYGSLGFPNGMQESKNGFYFQFHTLDGLSFRLKPSHQ